MGTVVSKIEVFLQALKKISLTELTRISMAYNYKVFIILPKENILWKKFSPY